MRKVRPKAKNKHVEAVLRRHIRRILTNAGFNLASVQQRQVEDEVLALFRDYSSSPNYAREEAYKRGRKRVLETLESF